jgi:putative membrane protein
MNRIALFFKGVCMGLADIVPGVSGGTMALILGIYTEFIDSIKGLHLRWVKPLLRWLTGGRKQEDWDALRAELGTLNLPFLITLGTGILVALGIGSMVIPTLMAEYPVQMRAFFFGLILASVWVPLRMIQTGKGPKLAGVILAAVLGAGFGFVVTNPGNTFEITREWTEVTSEGETLEHLARRAPSAIPTDAIYWSPKNEALRESMAASAPEVATKLDTLHYGEGKIDETDKKALKARAEPYNEIMVPAGVSVQVPRPAYWYVFAAGAVAISAMLLPGISGSYILLILGAYFFILNALKGFIKTLVGGAIPVAQAGYVIVFLAGVSIGILTFARILSYLLHKFPAYTLAALVGLMIGCLRGIWPFRSQIEGVVVNVWPSTMSGPVVSALVTFVVGMLIVGTLTWLGSANEDEETAKATS